MKPRSEKDGRSSDKARGFQAFALRVPRWVYLIAAAAAFLASSLGAYLQPLPLAPLQSPALDTWAGAFSWFLRPIERNGYERLAQFPSAVGDFWIDTDGRHVWVVGYGGLVIHSADGGRTWKDHDLAGASAQEIVIQMPEARGMEKTPVYGRPDAAPVEQMAPPAKTRKDEKPEAAGEDAAQAPSGPPTSGLRVGAAHSLVTALFAAVPSEEGAKTKGGLSREPDSESPAPEPTQKSPAPEPEPEPESSLGALPISLASAIHFCDENHGCLLDVGSEAGTVFITSDGGARWTRLNLKPDSGARLDLRDVYCVSPDETYAVGSSVTSTGQESAVALRMQQRGGTSEWQAIDGFADVQRLTSIVFADERNGWIVGEGPKSFESDESPLALYKTANGGGSWDRAGFPEGDLRWVCVEGTWGKAGVRTAGGEETAIHTLGADKDTWTREAVFDGTLTAVSFINPRDGWAYGIRSGESNGALFRTRDGGRSWDELLIDYDPDMEGAEGRIEKLWFTNSRQGWALDRNCVLLRTRDEGNSWSRFDRPTLTSAGLFDKQYALASRWNAPPQGRVLSPPQTYRLSSRNGGAIWSWKPVHRSPQAELLQFVKAEEGPPATGWATEVATANHTVFLTTKDQGSTWHVLGDAPHDFAFVDEKRGWAIHLGERGEDDRFSATQDGGESWTTVELPDAGQGTAPNTVRFANETTGWVLGSKGAVWVTHDSGKIWLPLKIDIESVLQAGFVLDEAHMWFSSEDELAVTTDGGTTWMTTAWSDVGLPGALERYEFADARHGWGREPTQGELHATSDGGSTWVEMDVQGLSAPVIAFGLESGTDGWAIDVAAGVARTEDGGTTWSRVTLPHQRWPAPWYFASLLLVAGLVVPAVWRPKAASPVESIADTYASDHPLDEDDPDALDFDRVARGLSRYLQNKNTEPPLTIAITGAWGSGKSSLMNLLRMDLKRCGFHPVWFNAWHHQKEEQLLASLLEAIRYQAIPVWWHPRGIAFRLRLAWNRAWRNGTLTLLGVAALIVFLSIPYLLTTTSIHDLAATPPFSVRLLGLVVSALGGVASLWKLVSMNIKAFGVKPAALTSRLRSTFQLMDSQEEVGARQRFMRDFRDVTRALNPKTMPILIDDLDRCRPENVVDILRTVNFLVSSGECYVIMGIERQRVVGCLAHAFGPVAENIVQLKRGDLEDKTTGDAEQARQEEGADPKDAEDKAIGGKEQARQVEDGDPKDEAIGEKEQARRIRADYANQWLEKLINIQVPVPTPTEDQVKTLLASRNEPLPLRKRIKDSLPTLMRALRVWVPFTLILLAIGLLAYLHEARLEQFALGIRDAVRNYCSTEPATSGLVLPRPTPRSAEPSPGEGEAETSGEIPKEQKEVAAPSMFVPASEGRTAVEYLLVPALALLGVVLWFLLTRYGEELRDSPPFREALDLWSPILADRLKTPRALKRFVNRVRYYAMVQPPEGAKTEDGADAHIPEGSLVALGALQQCCPESLDGEGSIKERIDKMAVEVEAELMAAAEPSQRRRFEHAGIQQEKLAMLREAVDVTPPLDDYVQAFRALSRGVHL